MRNNLEISFEGDHIRVISDGDKDYQFQNRLWQEVAAACEEHDCFRVLGISNTSTPLEAVESYETTRIFRDLKIDRRYRIAWVELNDESRDMAEFIVTVLSNRGLPGQLFVTEEEAKKSLLESD